jgi:hypothetical protein
MIINRLIRAVSFGEAACALPASHVNAFLSFSIADEFPCRHGGTSAAARPGAQEKRTGGFSAVPAAPAYRAGE